LSAIVDALALIQARQFARSVQAIRELVSKIKQTDFDFESATNLLALMAQLANKAIQLDEVESVVDTLGMRFCTNRSMSELLAGAAETHPPYAERIRACNTRVLQHAENAMAWSMAGDPALAVKDLLIHGNETLNAKLIETAHLVLQKYADKIPDAHRLRTVVEEMRSRFTTASLRPTLGEPRRLAGGLMLRASARAPASSPESAPGSKLE
jgi:hypothetical protein